MLILLALQAAACLTPGTANVALSGMVKVETDPGDPTHGRAGYRYARLTLDKPVCLRTPDNRSHALGSALIEEHRPNLTLPFRFKDRHVTVTATHIAYDPKAPLPLLLEDPTIAPDQD